MFKKSKTLNNYQDCCQANERDPNTPDFYTFWMTRGRRLKKKNEQKLWGESQVSGLSRKVILMSLIWKLSSVIGYTFLPMHWCVSSKWSRSPRTDELLRWCKCLCILAKSLWCEQALTRLLHNQSHLRTKSVHSAAILVTPPGSYLWSCKSRSWMRKWDWKFSKDFNRGGNNQNPQI